MNHAYMFQTLSIAHDYVCLSEGGYSRLSITLADDRSLTTVPRCVRWSFGLRACRSCIHDQPDGTFREIWLDRDSLP
jgi:hypothetical protein